VSTIEPTALRTAEQVLEHVEHLMTREYPASWSTQRAQDERHTGVLQVLREHRELVARAAVQVRFEQVAALVPGSSAARPTSGGPCLNLPSVYGEAPVAFIDADGVWVVRTGGESTVSHSSHFLSAQAPPDVVAHWLTGLPPVVSNLQLVADGAEGANRLAGLARASADQPLDTAYLEALLAAVEHRGRAKVPAGLPAAVASALLQDVTWIAGHQAGTPWTGFARAYFKLRLAEQRDGAQR
jgi:hypothetical protein